MARVAQRREQRVEARTLRSAPDQAMALGSGCVDRAHAPHRHLAREAAHGDGSARLRVEPRAQRRAHVVGHDRLARARELLETRRQVHRVAGDRVVGAHRAARRCRDDLAARDADVRRERPPELGGQRGHRVVDVARGPHRALDVVAVRDRRAEHRHRRVADVLVDRASRARDDAVDHLEVAAQQPVNLLGVGLGRELREAREVGEEHRHRPALASGWRPRGGRRRGRIGDPRAALRAEAGLRRQLRTAFPTGVRRLAHVASWPRERRGHSDRASIRRVSGMLRSEGCLAPRIGPVGAARPMDAPGHSEYLWRLRR